MNNKKPLISVALFCYQHEEFIEDALSSILNQSYSPLEVIINDDASTDGSYEKIVSLVNNYRGDKVITINQNTTNKGFANSVNHVFGDLCNGEWIVTAAGDDISLSNRVEDLWSTVKDNPNIKGYECSVTRMDKVGTELNDIHPKTINLDSAHKESLLGAAAAYHKDVYEKFGALDGAVKNEDKVLTYRACLLGELAINQNIGVHWRRHDNNLSGTYGKSFRKSLEFELIDFTNMKVTACMQKSLDLNKIHLNDKCLQSKLKILLIKDINNNLQMSLIAGFFLRRNKIPLKLLLNLKQVLRFLFILIKRYLSELRN